MANKRKYIYTYSNNTDEEELKVRQDFAEMVYTQIFKKGLSLPELYIPIWIICIAIMLYFNWKIWLIVISTIFVLTTIIYFIFSKNKSWKN